MTGQEGLPYGPGQKESSNIVSTELLVFPFRIEDSGAVALAELKEWKEDGIIEIVNTAVLSRDSDGESHARETADPEPGKGALVGALADARIGLLAGPAGVAGVAAAGARAGGFAAHKIALGIPNDQLVEIAERLLPGTSGIFCRDRASLGGHSGGQAGPV